MSVKWYLHKLAMMFGAEARRPTKGEETDAAREMKKFQKTPEQTVERRKIIQHELDFPVVSNKWKFARWTSIILINVMFIVSFAWDVQLVEGAMTASRFLGFHMADPTGALQVMLAFKQIMLNLLIGTVTVMIIWWFLAVGRFVPGPALTTCLRNGPNRFTCFWPSAAGSKTTRFTGACAWSCGLSLWVLRWSPATPRLNTSIPLASSAAR